MPKSKKKKTSPKRKAVDYIFGTILIAAGILYVYLLPNLTPKQPISPIKIDPGLLNSKQVDQIPTKIVIPRINIDLPVTSSKIINGYWELSDTTASYGEGSASVGQRGNMVIFAHARVGLFYNLKDARLGDNIYVFTKNRWREYKIKQITSVYPNQTEVIKPTSNETLTLYTCTGFYDEKRLIVKALPLNI